MPAEKATGIVIRTSDWSETSRIATFFTREFGKIRVLAKGGRRLKSNFEVALDLLTVCSVVFLRKSGGLDLLTEARAEERFRGLRSNLAALYAGYYIAELLGEGTQDYDPHPALYDEALGTLRDLNASNPPPTLPSPRKAGGREMSESPIESMDRQAHPPDPAPGFAGGATFTHPPPGFAGGGQGGGHIETSPQPLDSTTDISTRLMRFELVWLHELGYRPRFDGCAVCEAEQASSPRGWLFSPAVGGLLCARCEAGHGDKRPVSEAALEKLRQLDEPVSGVAPAGPLLRVELRQLLGHYVSYVLGRRPKTLAYIE